MQMTHVGGQRDLCQLMEVDPDSFLCLIHVAWIVQDCLETRASHAPMMAPRCALRHTLMAVMIAMGTCTKPIKPLTQMSVSPPKVTCITSSRTCTRG